MCHVGTSMMYPEVLFQQTLEEIRGRSQEGSTADMHSRADPLGTVLSKTGPYTYVLLTHRVPWIPKYFPPRDSGQSEHVQNLSMWFRSP